MTAHKIGMTKESAALRVRMPNDVGRTANDYGLLLYDCTTSSQAHAVPSACVPGGEVIIHNRGSVEAFYAFSTSASAAIDETPTATASGASDQIARPIAPGDIHRGELPPWEKGQTLYLVRRCASSSTSLLVEPGEPG